MAVTLYPFNPDSRGYEDLESLLRGNFDTGGGVLHGGTLKMACAGVLFGVLSKKPTKKRGLQKWARAISNTSSGMALIWLCLNRITCMFHELDRHSSWATSAIRTLGISAAHVQRAEGLHRFSIRRCPACGAGYAAAPAQAAGGFCFVVRKAGRAIGVLFGCFAKHIEGPGLPGGSIIYQGHLFSKRDSYGQR